MNVIEEVFPIKEVTVYPDSARIRRIQHINLKKGENELIIKGLPELITEESIRIEFGSSDQVKILDILSRDNFIEHYNENKYRAEMRKVEELVLKQRKIEACFRNDTDEFLLFLNKQNLTEMDFEELQRTIIVKNWEEFFLFVRKKLTDNRPGDWIIADDSGVMVIPKERAVEIANRALDVKERENRIREEIQRGSTLSEVLELEKWEKNQ